MDGVDEPNWLSIEEALAGMEAGRLTPQALVDACGRQIERLNPVLCAFTRVIEAPLTGASGQGRLAGIPVAIKDLFEMKGLATTAGTLFFEDHISETDADAVERLKNAGAVILGKTNTHEIALGVTTVNPHFGTTRNPWNTKRIAGGSSGGSAVAVAAGMALAATGTDTGGSIRIPASLCGIVGLKPTYGRISVRGVFPLSWNLDHVGALTRTVRDAAILLQILAGYDAEDPFSIDQPVDDYLVNIEAGVQGWKIAIASGAYLADADVEVLGAVETAAKGLEAQGAVVEAVDMTFLREAALANGLMVPADGAAAYRDQLAEHPDWFGADVRKRLEIGQSFTSTEYILARKTQSEMKHRMRKFFDRYDALLMPSTPITAPLIEGNDAVEQARRLTRFTSPFNLTGLPAISAPCGFDSSGLPIGLQIVAGAWREAWVLRAARAHERATDWGKRKPVGGNQ